jgi:hypothetical protein
MIIALFANIYFLSIAAHQFQNPIRYEAIIDHYIGLFGKPYPACFWQNG